MYSLYSNKSISIIILFLLAYTNIFSHSEHVHQYVAREEYKLLKFYIGSDAQIMSAYLRTTETDGYSN